MFSFNETNMFDRESPIECYKLNIIVVYCIILFLTSIIYNLILLLIFYKHKKLRTNLNIFIIALTILNLFGAVSQFIFVIPSNLYCRWIFDKIGCYLSGFSMYLVGCNHIYLMTAISIQRYLIVYKPAIISRITPKICYYTLLICFGLSLFWSAAPFFGWSNYSLEGGLTSCSVEWAEKSWNVYSYNMAVWTFAYIIPLVIIVYCNIKTIYIVQDVSKVQSLKRKNRIKREKRISIVIFFQIFGYFLTWTPYSFVSMYSAFVNSDHISPMGATLPAMFAKSSLAWSTILFIHSNQEIESKLNLNLFRNQSKQATKDLPKKTSNIKLKFIKKEVKIYWV